LLFSHCTRVETHKKVTWPGKPDSIIAHPSGTYMTPEESMKHIYVPQEYHLELVASEPMIKEPVTIAWDGDGNLYVAELNTYMQNIDGTGENDPTCRIMRLEDSNGDGKMDKSTVFIDSLVMPRMMLCVGRHLLVNETNSYNIWNYSDTDGDGKADKRTLAYANDKKDTRNLEHQKSGLLWNLDNWIYVSCDPVRYRYSDGKLLVDSLANSPGGQWGIATDNYGRLFFSNAGAEIPALGYQMNPAYGLLNPSDQYAKGFQEVWPIIASPDAKPGARHWRPDSSLDHFTSSCGQTIFRGDRLPENIRGDLFICEPAGRLIRRAKITDENGKIVLHNAYDHQEFITSSDMNFRPVHTATGPDGCLYIVDMNRGIIQESTWVEPGSLIRKVIEGRGLENNIGHGRIYRLVHDGFKRGPKPDMLNASSAKLVTYLGHPNGWWRDNAQKELIIRGDKSVAPALRQMAVGRQSFWDKLLFWNERPNSLARIHALWTLEGLHAIDTNTLFQALQDEDPHVRKTAVWISEPYVKRGVMPVIDKLAMLKNDPSPDVRIQLMESLFYSKTEKAWGLIQGIINDAGDNQIFARIFKSLEVNQNTKLFGRRLAKLSAYNRKQVLGGAVIFKQLCSSCHGPDGRGLAIGGSATAAPPFVNSKEVGGNQDHLIRILLNGLSGPIHGKTYSDVMPPLGAANSDEWVASILSYIRYEFAQKKKGFIAVVKPQEVKKIRELVKGRNHPWTLKEFEKMTK
ncbi:MAG TPA: c-type cytochrome, partial [Chitinophagaceae bacterium]|nr:c-type cytochrome [Chitinophagaceae bacterium]